MSIKASIILGALGISLWASDSGTLQRDCLQCHQEQQIPSGLIYKRYLMKYSTPERIENAMFRYMKNPQKAHSIMPPQFFLKFPMKPRLDIGDEKLKGEIRRYIQEFDLKKRLVLEKSSP